MSTAQRVSRGFQAASLIASLLLVTCANADEENAQLARTMWSAFQCAMFASLAEKREESERLSNVGIQAGRGFFEAMQAGKISKEDKVPVGVQLDFGGPSIDFVIGKIYSHARDLAYDEIVKKNEGLPLESKDWVYDEGLQKIKAENAYHKGNCVLIKLPTQ